MTTFYCTESSLSSQACLILIRLLRLEVEICPQELNRSDLNPLLMVPVLVDGELVLTEIRAILVYLAETSDYFASDKKKRAMINQRLFYDASVVFPSLMKLIRPIVFEKKKEVTVKHRDAFLAVIRVLEGLLVNSDFLANNEISLADISILPSIVVAVKLGLNLSPYPSLSAWFERLSEHLGEFDELEKCAESLAHSIKCVASVF